MSWVARSCPPDTEPWADEAAQAPDDPLAALTAERGRLIALVRPRIRSTRQERIRRQIAALTRQILVLHRSRRQS